LRRDRIELWLLSEHEDRQSQLRNRVIAALKDPESPLRKALVEFGVVPETITNHLVTIGNTSYWGARNWNIIDQLREIKASP
jgi:hypothetical protein